MTRRWTIVRLAPVVVAAVTALVYNTLPAITGVLARQLGFQPGALGAFGSADLLGMAMGALAAIAVMRKTSPRTTAGIGLVLLLVANFGSAISGLAAALVPLRAVGGVGTGLTASACYYMYSLEDQQRNSAASTLAQIALAVIVITAIPKLAHAWGWRSMFIGLGVLLIPCFLLAREFSGGYEESAALDSPGSPAVPPVILWLGLLSSALFNVGVAIFWAYIERIGATTGIAEDNIATGLSISTGVGLLGAILVIAFGDRIRGRMIAASVIVNILGIVASSSPVPWVYVAAVSAFYGTIPIYSSAQFSALMRRSSSSRLAAQFTLSIYVGALGPALGGLAVSEYGVLSLRWPVAVLTALSGVLLWLGFFSPYAAYPRAGDGVGPDPKRNPVAS
jgi:predicted MFS family arabinose efflux permease